MAKLLYVYLLMKLNWKKIMGKKENAQDLTDETINDEMVENEAETPEISREEELEIQVAEAKDKYLRLYAEFENYKKRNIKERMALISSAAQDTMAAMLPVLDDFDRAKLSAEDEGNDEHPFSEGVMLVFNKLHNILANKGLKKIECAGEAFDPELHEAITKIPAPSEELKGKIVDVIESGYYLNDKIIRYPKVVVGE